METTRIGFGGECPTCHVALQLRPGDRWRCPECGNAAVQDEVSDDDSCAINATALNVSSPVECVTHQRPVLLCVTAARQKVGELQRAIRAYNGICVWHQLDDHGEHFPHTCKAPVLCELVSSGAAAIRAAFPKEG